MLIFNILYLQSTSPQEVTNLINFIKSNKAGGHGDILPYFLKILSYIMALLFSLILDCCRYCRHIPK